MSETPNVQPINSNIENNGRKNMSRPTETSGIALSGHLKIFDPQSGEVFVNKRNAIHYENFSLSLAQSMSNAQQGWISEMAFGNGGDRVETTTPENATCDVMGIDSVWNLGDKIESSSSLLENYIKN